MEKYIQKIIEDMKRIDYIKPDDIPNIDLYMDQVTTFMDKHLETSKRYKEDKLLTKTMINNYTKNNLLPPSLKKKYTKDHMYLLLYIYYMKNILSISDIQSILNPITKKFFATETETNMADIYKEIFRLEKEQAFTVTKDVIRKLEKSKEAFSDMEKGEDQDLLQMFSFICMLCFDVYMKKQLIETMIDEQLLSHAKPKATQKDDIRKENTKQQK